MLIMKKSTKINIAKHITVIIFFIITAVLFFSPVLKGKKILISGATGGIGTSLVNSFLDEGALLYLLGRDINALNKLKEISNFFFNMAFF